MKAFFFRLRLLRFVRTVLWCFVRATLRTQGIGLVHTRAVLRAQCRERVVAITPAAFLQTICITTEHRIFKTRCARAVSYTHLTLPTIYSV